MTKMGKNKRCLLRVMTLAAAVFCGGCWQPPEPTPDQTDHGLVLLLPGVVGEPWMFEWQYQALRDAGVEAEIRTYGLERPYDLFANLTEYEENRQKAADLAAEIVAYRQEHPAAPIDLVGYSGGGAFAIMVTEAVPEDVRLRKVLLIQASLSPDYDLTAALSRIDVAIVNFYCPRDWLLLGIGTQLFGTTDRAYVNSAGLEGFRVECAVPDPALRPKLVQHAWMPDAAHDDPIGNHLCILSYDWNRDYVAPHLRPGENGETGGAADEGTTPTSRR